MFFALAIIFAMWPPLVWWRAAGAVLMLGFGCYGVYVLRKAKQKAAPRGPGESE
ncbi:hypothetical protein NtRootA4_08840 [Arthrobacter sp. NtRootA4]|nr:hypothetical protein NtRootA2_11050 [Arthrobacter sp. NtRootA2]BCW13905.1 hypothetical protein NtRootA4_08840 [Arthrobacter sp. NtRootA4]BCW22240.1 hypothetical protein NtRootC7_11070 [Arthrobacter sp. NtRootC7]BCW26508.1 hypothetical protein NtRootC45_11080 [Arthrobacter sp. NtRootC45]BCW30777.1 hypothetical protein NtRootD5_11080 [Arthrobacter sp. NtRootD5]